MTFVAFLKLRQTEREKIEFKIINTFVAFLTSGDSVVLSRRKTKLSTGCSMSLVKHALKNVHIEKKRQSRLY